MEKYKHKLEAASNIAIIIVAFTVVAVMVKEFLLKPTQVAATNSAVNNLPASKGNNPVSTKISIPGIDWARNHRTLVLGLQVGCHYCTESSPFYQRLVKEYGQSADLKLVAVMPQAVDESKQYLSSHEIDWPMFGRPRWLLSTCKGRRHCS